MQTTKHTTAHRVYGGRQIGNETTPVSCPHCIPMWHFTQLLVHWVARMLMKLALILVDLGEMLSTLAMRVECWA